MKRIKWNMELMYDYCKEHNYDLPKDNQEYTKTKDNYVYICNKHGEYKQTWQNHKEGKGCRECGLERVKIKNAKTDKCYLQECKQKGLDLPIEPYVNNIKKIRHKCSKGHIYEQTPRDHLRGSGCPYCSGQAKRVDKEYYLVQCKERGYDLPIEKYINSKTPINHKCKQGHVYKQTPNAHLSGNGCPKCKGNYKRTPRDYYDECKDKGYDIPIEYFVDVKTPIKHKCSKGHVYKQRPSVHLQGQGCPKCRRASYNYYYNLWLKDNIDLPTKEQKINSSVDVVDFICSKGHKYMQQANQHTFYGCPVCNESHGERLIRSYLDKNHIKYEPQKRFKGLKDKKLLSYDFYLPKKNVLIEYQGLQHYESTKYFGGNERLEKQQYHDKLKREYAKNNGYILLEPTYKLDTQAKINDYLDKHLKK